MTPDESQQTINQAVGTLLASVPDPIRKFLTGPERDKITVELANKYHLRADQAGEFQRAFIFMLLGISDPNEFISTLQAVGISASIIDGITKDVNEQVFSRLQQEERSAIQPAPPPKPLVPPMTVGMRQQPAPMPPIVPKPSMPAAPPAQPTAPKPPALPVPPAPPIPKPLAPQQPQPNRAALREVLKGYTSTDPYREAPE